MATGTCLTVQSSSALHQILIVRLSVGWEHVNDLGRAGLIGSVVPKYSGVYIPGIADDWNGTLQLFHIESQLGLPVFNL